MHPVPKDSRPYPRRLSRWEKVLLSRVPAYFGRGVPSFLDPVYRAHPSTVLQNENVVHGSPEAGD